MTDICIYTISDVLDHKKKDGMRLNAYCFWEFRNLPTKIREIIEEPVVNFDRVSMHSDQLLSHIFVDDPECVIGHDLRLYIAVEGFIRGFFPIIAVAYPPLNDEKDYELRFHSDDWKDIQPVPQKPFQGFKYIKERYN